MSDVMGNMNNNTEITEEMPTYEEWEEIVIILVLVVLSALATFGNIMVVVAYKKTKSLQNATNYFILSLVAADILVATFIVNIHTMYMIIGWPYPTLSYEFCLLWLCVDYWVFQSSVFGVLLVTCDRYLSIKYPMKYRIWRTKNRIKFIIAANWVISFAIWVPIILCYGLKTSDIENEMTHSKKCDVGSEKIIPTTVIGCFLSYLLPILVISYVIIDTAHILSSLRNISNKTNRRDTKSTKIQKKDDTQPSFTVITNPYSTDSFQHEQEKAKQGTNIAISSQHKSERSPSMVNTLSTATTTTTTTLHMSEKYPSTISISSTTVAQRTLEWSPIIYTRSKATELRNNVKRLANSKKLNEYKWMAAFNIALGVSFVINVLPFGVIAIIRSICEDKNCISKELWFFGYNMCYLNSMLNPLCYAFANKRFKRAFKKLLFKGKNDKGNSVRTPTSIFSTSLVE